MRRPAARLVLSMLLLFAVAGCGGSEDAQEASQAVASLLASDDCLMLMTASASVERALGGAVGTDLASSSAFLAGFEARAPRELAGDVAVVRQAAELLASGGDAATLDQTGVRRAAGELAAWARTSCPG